MWNTLKCFLNPFDARYEDLAKGPKHLVVLRDFSAGLIVAMMAIPLAMGFAMASGLKPEQGIVGGAVAGLVGALFGGSKYQVYGPTAAFIPLIAGLMSAYATPTDPYAGHGFLVLASVISGVILMALGLSGLGKLAKWVPHSIVVGFTLGIAVTIALSQIGEVLGIGMELESILKKALQDPQVSIPGYGFFLKLRVIGEHLGEYRGEALLLALVTFLVTKYLLKISIYIPAPLVAIAIGIFLSRALSDGSELTLIKTKFGQIPTDFFVLTLPVLPDWNLGVFRDLAYFVVAIVFVSGIESLLCSRMADRLADNQGTPFNPNKEFWGQGLVQILVPILNGFPHTGALARTATNIKVGAVTPLAGIFKCFLKLGLAYYLASLSGTGADGLHRRHFDVGRREHGQTGGDPASVRAQLVPCLPHELHGRRRDCHGLHDGGAHGDGPLRCALQVLRHVAISPGTTRGTPTGRRTAGCWRPLCPCRCPRREKPDAVVAFTARTSVPWTWRTTRPEPASSETTATNRRTTMHRYRDLMVGLARTNADERLIRYAAMAAELGTAERFRFVHVLPNSADAASERDHDRVRAELQANVQPHLRTAVMAAAGDSATRDLDGKMDAG